ncbi:MAG: aminoacetone oxidase family FAD-binding enzyme [Bacilli bacterium]|nr:aminoacetone oxidase family FAD-binding enzyme [Bacilli bacterium]
MRVAIIGGSASGLYSAILIKRAHPDFEVALFEKNDSFGKKLAATGNGHCNLLNKNLTPIAYHNNDLASRLIEKYPYERLEATLKGLGVSLYEVGDLVYPSCYHAPTYVSFLLETARGLGVELYPSFCFKKYRKLGDGYAISFEKEEIEVDKIVFALGAKSQARLGSDGSFVQELSSHRYKVNPFLPSLCPIRLREKVKKLSGLRHKANVKAYINERCVYEENGEILFKDDGLSGIAIMNASSYLVRGDSNNSYIELDLFPSLPLKAMKEELRTLSANNQTHFLDTLLIRPLKEYLLYFIGASKKEVLDESDIDCLAEALKCLTFHYEGNYGFDQSQVSIGGIDINEVREGNESKRENGVYFVGEMLDVDGICGGYNLSFALACSLEVASYI